MTQAHGAPLLGSRAFTLAEADQVQRWRENWADHHIRCRIGAGLLRLPGRTSDDIAGFLKRNPRPRAAAA